MNSIMKRQRIKIRIGKRWHVALKKKGLFCENN